MVERANLDILRERFDGATCPEEVFGALAGDESGQKAALRVVYARLSRGCHPDLVTDTDKPYAERTFELLVEWKAQAERKIALGSYGDGTPAPPPPSRYQPVTLTVHGKQITLRSLLAEGTFATVHVASSEEHPSEAAFVKVTRDPRDNDLIEREFATLRRLHEPDEDPAVEAFLRKQRAYVPKPLATFFVQGENDSKHRATLLSVPPCRSFTVEALRREHFPDGVDPRHGFWIFRRLLLTLWMAHLKGFAHGAVTPDHVLVFPEEHGIVLLDWTCSAELGEEYVPAFDPRFAAYCPPEMRERRMATPAFDLYMAGATAVFLMGGDPATGKMPPMLAPPILRALESCLEWDPRFRPQDAEEFYTEFGRIIEAVCGKRTFTPMIVP